MPIDKDKVTIVIPTLNEREAIGTVLDKVMEEGYHNILVVDGYSIDGTDKLAMEKGVKVIHQQSPNSLRIKRRNKPQ
jgi:dolichol-phosphate mannosyltransferase